MSLASVHTLISDGWFSEHNDAIIDSDWFDVLIREVCTHHLRVALACSVRWRAMAHCDVASRVEHADRQDALFTRRCLCICAEDEGRFAVFNACTLYNY